MKKRMVGLLLILGLLTTSLIGCGGGKTPASSLSGNESADTTTTAGESLSTDSSQPEESGATTPGDPSQNNSTPSTKSATTTKNPGKATSKPLFQTDLEDGLPKADLKGFTLRVAGWRKDLLEPKQNINDLGDERYKLMKAVEKRFNCKIEFVYVDAGKMAEVYAAKINSGDSTVPHIFLPCTHEAGGLLTGQLLQSIDSMKYIDLSKPWWNASMAQSGMVGGKKYMLQSPMTMYNEYAWMMVYNKKIAGEIGLTEKTLYDLVNSKQWTWDKFTEYAKKAVKDQDGDGRFTEKDRWGFSGPATDTYYAFMTSAGVDYVTRSGNKLTYGLNNSKAITAMNQLNVIFNSANIRVPSPNNDVQIAAFENGNTLFGVAVMGYLLGVIRKMDVETGLLPMPLGPGETQYRSRIDHNAPVILIPKTNKDLDNTGLLLEAMASTLYKMLPDEVSYYEDLHLNEGDKNSSAVMKSAYETAYSYPSQYMTSTAFVSAVISPVKDMVVTTQNVDVSALLQSLANPAQALLNELFN